jgi:putative holliday junction resolvase
MQTISEQARNEFRSKAYCKRIMAIDPGMKRIGVAWCDALHIAVSPHSVIDMDTHAAQAIATLALQNDVAIIVVGIPERAVPSAMTIFAEEFAGAIEAILTEKNSSIAVMRIDESFSTRHAFQAMHTSGMKKKKREEKGKKDAIAACIILQNFLEEYQ